MKIAKRIKEYRDQHGLTQADMAEMIGCTPASICKWEQGAVMLGVSALALETVLSLDDPATVLERVRAGAGTAMEQEAARLTAENVRLRARLERWEAWAKNTISLMKEGA